MKVEAHLPFTTSLFFSFLFSLSPSPLSSFKPHFSPTSKNSTPLLSLFPLFLKQGFSSVQHFSLQNSKHFQLSLFTRENPTLVYNPSQDDDKMITPSFVDEIDCGSFFDNIDDLMEDVDSVLGPAPDCNSAFSLWPAAAPLPPPDAAVFSGNGDSDFSSELPVPYEEMVHLEWLSNFVENSEYSGGDLTMNKQQESYSLVNKESSHQQFQTSSPISVLDSSSSCSGEKNVLEGSIAPGRRGRARSKRPRPATFNPRSAIQLISPASSVSEIDNPLQQQSLFAAPKVFSESENFAESRPVVKMPKQASGEQKKKKRIKLPPQVPGELDENSPLQGAIRKCLHCEITKTPQWRAGPMGPKTLCNACGVRYKSGRLFPEYRPAASPTFVPALHSNSHKKVLEMRTKGGEMVSVHDNSIPELIPITNSSISLDYM